MYFGSVAAGQDSADDVARHAKALSKAFRQAASVASPSVVTVLFKAKPLEGLADDGAFIPEPRLRELLPEGFPEELRERLGRPDAFDGPDSVGSGVLIDASG
ncbi:MAG: hypothetical protein KDA41_07380, partial [Planctomycetales bacterium]|nr:hypothetical protein [Planctomycetales bacterium]